MDKKKRMSAADFELCAHFVTCTDERRDAARSLLVDGESHATVSSRYGKTRQWAASAAIAFVRTLERYNKATAEHSKRREGDRRIK